MLLIGILRWVFPIKLELCRGFVVTWTPTELMGFAARDLFMKRKSENNSSNLKEVGPLEAWKRFLEANLIQKLNSI